jgi:hypothetical protein
MTALSQPSAEDGFLKGVEAENFAVRQAHAHV